MGEVNPEESLEISRGVFKRLGDCTGSDIESAIGLIAQRRIDRAWIAEQAAGPDRSELTIARRFFADTTDAERDLIAYWQMVKLVEEAHLRYTTDGDDVTARQGASSRRELSRARSSVNRRPFNEQRRPHSSLAPLELRFALVHEGGDPFLEVVAGAQQPVREAFELQAES